MRNLVVITRTLNKLQRERRKRMQKNQGTLIWMKTRKDSKLTYLKMKNQEIVTKFQEKRKK